MVWICIRSKCFPELIERISEIPGVEWIRLHYAYPAHFPTDLFRVMRERSNVCKYMDIALQHISNPMLEKMRRHVTQEETYQLIEQFRKEVPRYPFAYDFNGRASREKQRRILKS